MSVQETTIVEPLSGEEIMEAEALRLKRLMQRDCHLNPALAYLAYEVEWTVKLKLKDNGREERVEMESRSSWGPKELLKDAEVRESYLLIGERGPNVIRQEAGLGIPTLTETGAGRREIKKVKYAQKAEPPETETELPEPEPPMEKKEPPKPQPGQPGPAPKQPPHERR